MGNTSAILTQEADELPHIGSLSRPPSLKSAPQLSGEALGSPDWVQKYGSKSAGLAKTVDGTDGGAQDGAIATVLGRVAAPSYISRPNGQVAQLVEQRTENPRVGGSIPSLAIHA